MTLKSRNKIFFFLFITGIIITSLELIHIFLSIINGHIFFPEKPFRTLSIFPDFILFRYNPYASLAGIFVFALAVPILSGICFRGFAKTPSLEIFFFIAFIIACITEQVRIIIPLAGPKSSYAHIYSILTRILLTGRILGPLALFFSFTFNQPEQRQNAERNTIILFLVSILGGHLFPLDTYQMTSTFSILWSYRKIFFFFNLMIFLSTVSVIIVDLFIKKITELKSVLIGFIFMSIGYFILQLTDCWVEFALATTCLCFGCYKYLWSIHDLNMWR